MLREDFSFTFVAMTSVLEKIRHFIILFFKKLLGIGDFLGLKGYIFTTQTGEISLHVTEMTVLSKSVKPLPIVKRDEEGNIHDGFYRS